MPVRHDFSSSDHPLPVFLSSRTEEYEEPRGSSWLRRLSLFVMAVGVIGAAMTLSLGNPLNIFGLADQPSAPPSTDQSTSSTASTAESTASTAETQGLLRAAAALPAARDDTPAAPAAREDAPAAPAAPIAAAPTAAATSTPATDNQAQASDPPPPGALLKQFQSWAAAQDAEPAQDTPRQDDVIRPIVQEAQPQAQPPQPEQQAAAPATDDTPPPIPRAAPKHRKPRPVQNARAEIRPAKPSQAARADRAAARADARPVQDGRPPEQQQQQPQPQTPAFLQSIGIGRQQ